MTKKRVEFNGKVVELLDFCQWEVRNGVLWNLNTNHDEGVDGDIVEYYIDGVRYLGHVDDGYTCYQFIHTKEWGGVCLSSNEYNVTFTHVTPVKLVND